MVMAVTPDTIAVALGRTAPEPASPMFQQWEMWIGDAEVLIDARMEALSVTDPLDENKRDYVVREAVVAQVKRPDDATQVTVSVDDGTTSKTYRSARGRVEILDEWWALLGLTSPNSGAFAVDTVSTAVGHAPWCDVMFGSATCSCGVSLGIRDAGWTRAGEY